MAGSRPLRSHSRHRRASLDSPAFAAATRGRRALDHSRGYGRSSEFVQDRQTPGQIHRTESVRLPVRPPHWPLRLAGPARVMESLPQLSIIIPAFNEENRLPRALQLIGEYLAARPSLTAEL